MAEVRTYSGAGLRSPLTRESAPVLRSEMKSRGKCVCSSHFPPAEVRLATHSRRLKAFKKCSQLSRRPELWDGFQFLES